MAWLVLECIRVDRIDGRKTHRSVIGDAVVLICHHQVPASSMNTNPNIKSGQGLIQSEQETDREGKSE